MPSTSNKTDDRLPKPEGPLEDPNNGDAGPSTRPHGQEGEGPETVPTPGTEGANAEPEPRRHYPPRMCRICLETVMPTYETAQEGIAGFVVPRPRVSYISADPKSGRLIRPCKCKGSTRYVHEGCLRAWRHADRRYSLRNFWECPTCGFRYQLERMRYARWITSTFTQILLTIVVMIVVLFLSGFIVDPVVALWLGPIEPLDELPKELQPLHNAPWLVHFVKGMLSVGVISFASFPFVPALFGNLPPTRLMAAGGRRPGRERLESMTLNLVVVGLVTVMMVGCRFAI
jgi:hypothetical protein